MSKLRHYLPALAGAGLCVLGMTSSASAQATRLRVTQADNAIAGTERWLQLAEVQALAGGTNVAASANGGTATASSSGFGTIPEDANDGNTDGNYGNGSLWHSGVSAVGEFWEVTFQSPANVDTINLFGRSDCCQNRDNNLTVQLFNANGDAIFTANNVALVPDAGQGLAVLVVPEPATLGLAAVGLLGLAARRPRRR